MAPCGVGVGVGAFDVSKLLFAKLEGLAQPGAARLGWYGKGERAMRTMESGDALSYEPKSMRLFDELSPVCEASRLIAPVLSRLYPSHDNGHLTLLYLLFWLSSTPVFSVSTFSRALILC